MDNNNKNGNQNNNKRSGGFLTTLIIFSMMALIVIWMIRFFKSDSSTEITYNEFLKMVDEQKIEKVIIRPETIEIKQIEEEKNVGNILFGSSKGSLYTGKVEDDDTLTQRLLEKGIVVEGEIPDNSAQVWAFIFSYILPIAIFLGIGFLLFRRLSGSDGVGGIMNVGKSNAKVYVQKETGKTFKDVAGVDEAIDSLQEVVDFLHNPDKYVKIGAKLPKGVLLVGSPGTGKTLLAKAVAGEAHVPFFSLTGSDFVELYVGVGASRVRDLFKEAEKNAPCIVFIDEIDAIGRSRDSKYGGGNEEREQTLNQLLSEMDGFDGKKGIIILAATNRPEILDKALLRPGRFDRRVIVDKPDLKGRIEILKVHSKDVKLDESVDFEELALATSGAVGADLANMVNEAAIIAVKNKREYVSQKDLFDAVEIVIAGKEKKDAILSEKERKIVSYHEVGHALVAAVQKNSEPVQKITIVPRTMGSLGYVMHVPEEEKHLKSKEELHDSVVGYLGGRAAEEIVFGSITSGAVSDIEEATNIVKNMFARYGMSDRFGMVALVTVESQYLEGRTSMNCGPKTESDLDEEVMKYMASCYEEAKAIILDNREILDKIAAYLIEKENITGKEFMEIYCKEKGIPVPETKNPLNKNKVDIKVDDDTKTSEESEADKDVEKTDSSSDNEKKDEFGFKEISFESPVGNEQSEESSKTEEQSENKETEKYEDKKEPQDSDENKSENEIKEDSVTKENKSEEVDKAEEKELSEEERIRMEEEAEIQKAKDELSKEIFNRIQNRAFKFEDEEEDK